MLNIFNFFIILSLDVFNSFKSLFLENPTIHSFKVIIICFIIISFIRLVIFRNRVQQMPTLSNYVRVYAPIGVLVIALIIILIVPNNFNKNFDSNENRSIIKNLEDSNINIEIFQDSKCLKFETIHQDNNYTSAINYFTEEIIKLGFTHKNIFQVNKLEEGSGIIFVSIINTSGNGMDYCEKLNETFKKKILNLIVELQEIMKQPYH